jgi:hypothetical protein
MSIAASAATSIRSAIASGPALARAPSGTTLAKLIALCETNAEVG